MENKISMKQSEKLDLILRELYKHKNDGTYYSIGVICENINIPLDSNIELMNLARRLENDDFIKPLYTLNNCSAELTSYGIEYCEENSYSYSGSSVTTNSYSISIVNSPNSNIINESQNISIKQNISEVNKAIEKIREAITKEESIEKDKATEILGCLNEIQESIKMNLKPSFAIKTLLSITENISSISSWLAVLGQYAGIIPIA